MRGRTSPAVSNEYYRRGRTRKRLYLFILVSRLFLLPLNPLLPWGLRPRTELWCLLNTLDLRPATLPSATFSGNSICSPDHNHYSTPRSIQSRLSNLLLRYHLFPRRINHPKNFMTPKKAQIKSNKKSKALIRPSNSALFEAADRLNFINDMASRRTASVLRNLSSHEERSHESVRKQPEAKPAQFRNAPRIDSKNSCDSRQRPQRRPNGMLQNAQRQEPEARHRRQRPVIHDSEDHDHDNSDRGT